MPPADGFCLTNQATVVIGGILTAMTSAIIWLTKALIARDDERIAELTRLAYRGTETADRAIEHAERTTKR